MITNAAGKKIIMDSEGCKLTAYQCPAKKWTIGYGHTGDVKQGDAITRHQAEAILSLDLDRFEQGVSKLAPGAGANEFSALVSFAYNLGLGCLEQSSLLTYFNAGNKPAAARMFGAYVHGGGKLLPGLVKRRAAEAALFLAPVIA